MHKTKTKTYIFTCFMVCLISFFAFSNSVFASSITINLDSVSLSLTMAPNSTEGNFASSGNLGISVSLTGPGGYTLGIKAASSNASARNLINSTANTALTTISSAITPANYTDNTYASTNNLNNTWAYLPSKYNSADNTNYRPAPDANGDILDVTSAAGDGSTSTNYTISLAARADTSTKPGSYANTFIITAIANIPDCNPSATDISDAVCMQDMNDNVINSMTIDTQYRLYDNRDWKQYYIARLKDGKVWMTQNLDLDLETTPTNVAALTSENTNLTIFGSQNYTSENGYKCIDSGGNDITSTTSNNCTSTGDVIFWTPASATLAYSASWTSSNTTPASWDGGEYCHYTSGNTNDDNNWSMAQCTASGHTEAECTHYHRGNYYNWTATVASNSTSNLTTNRTIMSNSICPVGWRLPQGQTTDITTAIGYYSEINYTWVAEGLATNYATSSTTGANYTTNGFNAIRTAPMYMVRAGYKSSSIGISNAYSYGNYWTSTIYSTDYAYAPYFTSDNLFPLYSTSTYANRRYGKSVRCVAVPSANTGSTVITFDKNANDATGTMSNQTYNANTINTLPTNGFTRSGYAFNSWNTEPDGSGKSYSDADKYYAMSGNTTNNATLYAQWDKFYTITFNIGNNATGINFDGTTYANNDTVQAIEGKSYTISGNYATKYAFSSWSATAGTITNSSYPVTTYTVTGDATITLTGQEATTDMTTLVASSDPVSDNCQNEAVTPILVYDPRDNEAYWVARLCDGNYWMLDNLRLDLTNSTVINNLGASNTNASAEALSYLKNGGGSDTDKWPTASLSGSNWPSSYSFSAPLVSVSGTSMTGRTNNNWTGSYTKDTVAPTTYGIGSGKVGVFYNYCAASAGTYCWGYNTTNSNSPSSDPNTTIPPYARDIEGDICPAGWRLPTGGPYDTTTGGGEYQNLINKYDNATLGGEVVLDQHLALKTALSTPLSGYVNLGVPNYFNNNGTFWSSTWGSTTDEYILRVDADTVTSQSNLRYYGRSIRCILK